MPAVDLLNKADADASLNDIFDKSEKYFGQVPNLVKAMAHNPAMCSSITDFMLQSIGPGRIDWAFKELIILKTLRAFKSFYSFGAHERIALDLGVSPEKIGDLANSLWENSSSFSEAEKTVLELVEQIAEDANDVSDDLWERLRSHWENGQLLEITSVITTFVTIGRMGDSLGVSDPVLFSKALPK